MEILLRFGWIYLLLAIPAVWGTILALHENDAWRYAIFLGIFIVFLVFEALLDHVLKINFRENWRKNWKWLVPYLGLYYAMNYGFVVMPWKTSLAWGLIMLCLFIVQIVANLKSHSASIR